MCGVVGIVGGNREELDKMLKTIVHRGPDDEGSLVDDDFALGMRRLAIIGVSTGKQPIYNETDEICIFFNGEIYNYLGIKTELEKVGHKFKTNSDTEVIVHGYEEWGKDVLDKLAGMFVFIIYDRRKKTLFIARDRLGIKPLYYAYDKKKRFIFGSEIKTILSFIDKDTSPDYNSLYKYLKFRVHDDTEDTFFNGIKRLQPGHYLIISTESKIVENYKYWHPKINLEFKSNRSDESYAEEFRELFLSVINEHLISEVPVGVSLSGGLDSSGVVGAVRHVMDSRGVDLHTEQSLYTFSALYPNQSIDETEYITEVEKFSNTKPFYTYPKSEEFWIEIENWIRVQEEPVISSAPYAYYRVYKLASERVKVMLSGNGGDELLAGYFPYFFSYLKSAFMNREYIAIINEMSKSFYLYRNFFDNMYDKYLNRGYKILGGNYLLSGIKDHVEPFEYKNASNLNMRLAMDVTKYSTPNLLRYEDKNSMAFSIESRVPFLDHRLVEYIFSLPIFQKFSNGYTRFVYRNAMKGLMPEKNRLRKSKIGFTNPELKWLKERKDYIVQVFDDKFVRNYTNGKIDWNLVKSDFLLWCNSDSRIGGDPLVFWRYLNVALWIRAYFGTNL